MFPNLPSKMGIAVQQSVNKSLYDLIHHMYHTNQYDHLINFCFYWPLYMNHSYNQLKNIKIHLITPPHQIITRI